MFGHFLKKFPLVSHQYCFTCSLQVLLDVWRIWVPHRPNFWATLGPKQVNIPVFGHFLKKIPLLSHQSWCTCQFEQLLEVCCILASEAQFLGHFGPQNRSWFRSSVIFSNIFNWFHIIIFYMLLGGTFICISMTCKKALFLGLELRLQQSSLGRRASCLSFICCIKYLQGFIRSVGISSIDILAFLCSCQSLYLNLVVKYVFPLSNTRVTCIVDGSHSDSICFTFQIPQQCSMGILWVQFSYFWYSIIILPVFLDFSCTLEFHFFQHWFRIFVIVNFGLPGIFVKCMYLLLHHIYIFNLHIPLYGSGHKGAVVLLPGFDSKTR